MPLHALVRSLDRSTPIEPKGSNNVATVIAPISNQDQPTKRFAFTHIATPALVTQALEAQYVRQVGAERAQAFMARVEVRKGNQAPKDLTDVIQTKRGYF
jgi:hypothetical protein